jgi:hypothetical protein
MKASILFGLVIIALPSAAFAQYGIGSNPSGHYVSGHASTSGTYVSPHYQSNPNSTTLDNWGTSGNVNPYTGAVGHRSAY